MEGFSANLGDVQRAPVKTGNRGLAGRYVVSLVML